MPVLLQDLGDDAGPDRQPAFTNGELRALLQRHVRDQLHRQVDAVPRHHHLHPFRQRHRPGYVHRPNVELRPVPVEERLVPPPPGPPTPIPRATSVRSTPRNNSPALSPAMASSRSLWNISTPVTTDAMLFSRRPTISTPSPTLAFPPSPPPPPPLPPPWPSPGPLAPPPPSPAP